MEVLTVVVAVDDGDDEGDGNGGGIVVLTTVTGWLQVAVAVKLVLVAWYVTHY